MSSLNKHDQEEHTRGYQKLINDHQTLLLSTVSNQAEPECSYAPYVSDQQGEFTIFVSELATHTQNMLQSHKASILFIQSENETNNLFARKRVVFECNVSEVGREDEDYDKKLQSMKNQLGETVELLRSLPDFHLLVITAVKGKYIAGFGQAFSINTTDGSLVFDSKK